METTSSSWERTISSWYVDEPGQGNAAADSLARSDRPVEEEKLRQDDRGRVGPDGDLRREERVEAVDPAEEHLSARAPVDRRPVELVALQPVAGVVGVKGLLARVETATAREPC